MTHDVIGQAQERLSNLERHRSVRGPSTDRDLNVPMLARMFDRRCRGYEAVGYTVLLPASAIPGWPTDVILPSDPIWKRDYSGSVRRLIRDGVDVPLASLFVHVARTFPADADGVARARSATEAFLFRRLETLPETKGRFQLNVALPIPFDGQGRLEVDLLCADARVAIRVGRRPAPGGPRRVPEGSTQGPAPSGERLPHSPVSGGRRGQGPRPGARCRAACAQQPDSTCFDSESLEGLEGPAIVTA
jgi:hypothetical protein